MVTDWTAEEAELGEQQKRFIRYHDYVKVSNKIKYDNLYQALETNDYYIIFANTNSASMIRKKDIDEEDQADFGVFLKAKLGERWRS